MGANGNTVNIKRPGYHHGDLRAALIAEGLRLLASPDRDALSLRAVARGVGVSATAVYRHFPDKAALLTALALEGLARLGAVQRAASEAAGGGDAGFAATGRAYVRFALDHPALFRLIFASPTLDYDAVPADQAAMQAGALLMANAARIAQSDGGAARVRAIRSWALVHGLAMLMLDGKIPMDDALIAQAVS